MRLALKEINLLIYGLIMSTIIGSIAFAFLRLEGGGAELLWSFVSPDHPYRLLYIFCITSVGGVLVGVCHLKWDNLPVTPHDALAELKEKQTVVYRKAIPSLFVALIVLVFGAGVGPEAGLLGAVILLSFWQADKLRYYYFNYDQLKALSIAQRLKRLAHPSAYFTTYEEQRALKTNKKNWKKLFYGLFVINGTLTFYLLMKMVGQPSFITKMGVSTWQWQELWLLVPLTGFGVIYGGCHNLLDDVMEKKFTLWASFPIRRALLGSLAIFIIGVFLPNLLFSGQLSLSLAPFVGSQAPFLLLSLIAIIKLIFLQVCLKTGWVGGNIFPIVFAAIIQGFAIAQLFPHSDKLLIVAIVSVSIASSIIKSPWLVGGFMMLFFPLNLTPVILLVTLLLYGSKKLLDKNDVIVD